MWVVQTYFDRPTIFDVNWLNLATSHKIDLENGYKYRSPVFHDAIIMGEFKVDA